jgi:hypothetical protein
MDGPMDGGAKKRTRQPGHLMSFNRMEVHDAPHEEQSAAVGDPPAAAGDGPAEEDRDPGLIAHSHRPSYLQLLAALLAAEEELEQEQENQRAPSGQLKPPTTSEKEESP